MSVASSTRRRALLCAAIGLLAVGCLDFHAGAVAGAPKGAQFATLKGTRIHFTDSGEGPPVVLVHGFASSLNVWNGVKKALLPAHRVLALDLKGFGYSSRPEGDYSPKAQAELILALLDAQGVEGPVDFVAHSWGSSVVLELALIAPDRVRKIALYDAWVYEDQLPSTFAWARADGMGELLIGAFYDERADEKMASAFYDPKYVTEELVDTVEDQLARPGTKAAALAAIRGQRYEDIETRYKKIDKPVLLLWGREDRVTTLDYGERLSKELPNAHLTVYPQCGHFPMIEAVRPSTRDLVEFLAPAVAPPPVQKPPTTSEPAPPAPSSAPSSAPSDDPEATR